MAIMSTTEATPITIPSIVKKVRNRLAPIARQASPNMAENITCSPFLDQQVLSYRGYLLLYEHLAQCGHLESVLGD